MIFDECLCGDGYECMILFRVCGCIVDCYFVVDVVFECDECVDVELFEYCGECMVGFVVYECCVEYVWMLIGMVEIEMVVCDYVVLCCVSELCGEVVL